MSYSKLHSSIVHSSLWSQSDEVRILFVTLLALCDREGYVYGSRAGLERAANIRKSAGSDPWLVLMSPDPNSCDLMRNPENEGRRIEEVPGGFRLLNFEYYRGLRNDDDRREQNRRAAERHRNKSTGVSRGKPASAAGKPISDADADTHTDILSTEYPSELNDAAPPGLLDEVPAPKKRRGRPPKPPHPDHASLVEYFCTAWKAAFHTDYPFAGGKDGRAVKAILQARTLDEAKAIIDVYLGDTRDTFVKQQGHTLAFLASRLARYAERAAHRSVPYGQRAYCPG